MRVHFLDMGNRMYGDCILVEVAGRTILVDGAHPRDDVDNGDGRLPIQEQLRVGLGVSEFPLSIDLLVVTHCHSDHIGCLPELIASGTLEVKFALVADERYGFGRPEKGVGTPLSDNAMINRVVEAIREEPAAGLRTDDQLQDFILDAAGLEERYTGMLRTLAERGVQITRFGRDDVAELLKLLNIPGLKVLGPSTTQLQRCAEVVRAATADALKIAKQLDAMDRGLSDVEMYRAIAGSSHHLDSLDAPGKGAALNNLSIMLIVEDDGQRVLLTGDMQFASPGVSGLGSEMAALRQAVFAQAPFALVKLPHHGSGNGCDEVDLKGWGASHVAITTGQGFSGHPSPAVMRTLSEQLSGDKLGTWSRTDKNGYVKYEIDASGVKVTKSRGDLNDMTPNREAVADVPSASDIPEEQMPMAAAPGPEPSNLGKPEQNPSVPEAPPKLAVSEAPAKLSNLTLSREDALDHVEVIARLPNTPTRVTLTTDIEPRVSIDAAAAKQSRQPPEGPERLQASSRIRRRADDQTLGGGRTLPRLLFVTNFARLERRIGQSGAAQVREMLYAAGQPLGDIDEAQDPRQAVRALLGQAGDVRGVVLVGGHEVIPPVALDVLTPELRAALAHQDAVDPDYFVVWNDDEYGDLGQVGFPGLPVSRIPDAGSAELVLSCLLSKRSDIESRFGIRNIARPFADDVFSFIAGSGNLLKSHPHIRENLTPQDFRAASIYLMLHGDVASPEFTGEDDEDGYPSAIHANDIPNVPGSIVLSGACWGALTVDVQAFETRKPTSLPVEQSIALSFLSQGALAFVGCTGAHYSPLEGSKRTGSRSLHQNFWHFSKTKSPAQALYDAKRAFLQQLAPEGTQPIQQAAENKTLWQFTCLGLGW